MFPMSPVLQCDGGIGMGGRISRVYHWLSLTFLAVIAGCAQAPLHLKCGELERRLRHEELSSDQERFLRMELDDCHAGLEAAKARDSRRIDDLDKRFTPEER